MSREDWSGNSRDWKIKSDVVDLHYMRRLHLPLYYA